VAVPRALANQRQKMKKLGELLVQEGVVSEEDVRLAIDEQKKNGGQIGEILVSLGRMTEWDLARCLVSQLQLPFVSVGSYEIQQEVVNLLPHAVLHQHRIVPLDIFGKTLVLATAGGIAQETLEEIELSTQLDVMLYIATATDIQRTLQERFPLEKLTDAVTAQFDKLYADDPTS